MAKSPKLSKSRGAFAPEYSQLPTEIPLFPLAKVLLLPGVQLPLNIFEPRYLNMVRAALAQPHHLIGMIQPRDQHRPSKLYKIGCAGWISSYSQTDNGQLLITLSGALRFSVQKVKQTEDGYLMAAISWTDYKHDLSEDNLSIDRARLIHHLQNYFKKHNITADWEQIKACGDEQIVAVTSMICPFDIAEKQALLECENLEQRAEFLITILAMNSYVANERTQSTH